MRRWCIVRFAGLLLVSLFNMKVTWPEWLETLNTDAAPSGNERHYIRHFKPMRMTSASTSFSKRGKAPAGSMAAPVAVTVPKS